MIGSIHVARDISERKWAEERLLKAHNELELRVIERTSELAGTVTALQGEIDERKKTEAALEKSSREIEDLYNLAPCGYHSLNRDGTFIRINDTELKWLGYSRDEVIGKLKVSDIMPPESLVVLAENFPRFISGDEVTDMRFNFFRKDGSILPVLLNASPIMNEQGDYLMSRSTIYDITDLIQAEESIRRLNQLYLTLSETGKAIAHIPDRDGLFHEICRIAVEHGGFRMAWIGLVDEESGIVRPAAAFGSGMDYLENIRISARLEPEGMGPTGTAIRQNSHYICNDFRSDPCITPWVEKAESHGFHASAALAIKLNGSAIGALTLYSAVQEFFDDQLVELLVKMQEDISFALDNLDREARRRKIEYSLQKEITGRLQANEALREKEQMLLHQSRLAAMGEMINNIAHQWRQPLNTLGLIIQKMTLFYDTPEFNREFLEKNTSNAMEIIQHMSGTINDFRNFFRSDKEQETFAIDQVIRQTLKFIDQTLKDMNIEIVTHCEGAPMGSGYPNEFGHAILNILTNARDAFVEHKMEDARISLNAFVEVDTSVVTITDNAGGISEEIIDRLFDPYFSTKGPDKGTGLGLFIAKNIIENNMAGRLSVRNTGNGAEFRIEVKNGDN
jgi:PAS domain S-box-containing protein